ncbi:hypothetical protein BpHYR1_043416, partial [Brachionus plicatilis]
MANLHALDNHRQNFTKKHFCPLIRNKNYKIPIKKLDWDICKEQKSQIIEFFINVQSAYNVHFENTCNRDKIFINYKDKQKNFGSIQKPIKKKPYQLNNQSFRMKYFVRKYSCKISKKIFVK